MGDKFDDIDMLEIPDDEVSSSLETEAISESSSSSRARSKGQSAGPEDLFNSHKLYIPLQDWLSSDSSAEIEFQFDPIKYDNSLELTDSYSRAYVKYTNAMYKVIEGLTKQKVTRIELEQPQQEPIGVITSAGDTGASTKAESIINLALDSIIHHLNSLLEDITDTKPEIHAQLQNLAIILECLKANWFYGEANRKPELLVRWINMYDYKPDDEIITSIMIETPKPYLHPLFWLKLMSQLLTRGLFEQADEVLKGSRYQELIEDIQKAEGQIEIHSIISDFHELISNYTNFSLKGQFEKWKLKACEFRDGLSKRSAGITSAEHVTIARQIHDLACVITGLPKTISNFCEDWYELYVALALFQVRDDKVLYEEYFKLAIDEKPPAYYDEEVEELDENELVEACFVNIIEENFLKVLRYLYELDPITSACVAKLLELKGLLKNYYNVNTDVNNFQAILDKRTISEYFLTVQAYECLNVHDLVPIGIGLLLNEDISTSKSSHLTAKKVIESFLPKFHCKTNDDLEWVLTICAKLNLIPLSKQLYYNYGIKSLEEGLIYESLDLFVKSYDGDSFNGFNEGIKKIHYIVWDLIFQDSVVNNRPSNDELINNIVGGEIDDSFEVDPVIRQCLAPYAVLYKFFTSLAESRSSLSRLSVDGTSASMNQLSSLIHLLRFNHLPKKFYPLLLSQILPFLTSQDEKFHLPDLIMIIELIDSYELQTTKDEIKEGDALYKYSINHIEEETTSYDWRKKVTTNGKKIPETTDELVKVLRNEIISKIGQVYIK
ncbi:uncharacterized protein CANTADRAFT_52133 [Suhomyces tanzawaensis NRRL Y-17324]|uniref:Nuclear pore complex protein Nup85 n=1 Tax=Suhomyces tanzawaensis NRRL Y-17324 TaxID=984487 RepID=A0A1E4SJ36_9ASCO|nr:uncharacterized protein CANTADRAFT_52133 [Suhomyces tanzawaensis NRRL Y-17324]ODV79525.1 hypothetical protein CANTADRAFT_52133 [Suhomyces tanzawaensis NRRL Y-17324]